MSVDPKLASSEVYVSVGVIWNLCKKEYVLAIKFSSNFGCFIIINNYYTKGQIYLRLAPALTLFWR